MTQSQNGRSPRHPGVSALLSFVAPGLGQIYNGHFLWGVFWLVVTPGFWFWSAGLCGWPFHILSAWQAYRQAEAALRSENGGW